MATIYHQVWIDAPAAKVYEALSTAEGLGKWWAPHTSTQTSEGLIFAHSPGAETGDVQMKVLDRVPDQHVRVDDACEAHPTPRKLHADAGVALEREVQTAVLLRDLDAEESHVRHPLEQRLRELVSMLELAGLGLHLFVDPDAHVRDDLSGDRVLDISCEVSGHGPPHCSREWLALSPSQVVTHSSRAYAAAARFVR